MLVVRRGPNAGSRFVLDGEVTALGRHPDSDIFLDDITVSRRHAVVRARPPTATRSPTSARSTAPTSTTSGSTPRRCTTSPTSRSAGSCWCSSWGATSSERPGARAPLDRRGARRAARRVPRHHHLEDPVPREPGPGRTPSARRRGTGSSTTHDLVRLRWILHQQKEHFLPLKVIKERLDQLPPGDEALLDPGPANAPRVGVDEATAAPAEPEAAADSEPAPAPGAGAQASHPSRAAPPAFAPRSRSTTTPTTRPREHRARATTTRAPSSPPPPASTPRRSPSSRASA